MSYNTKSIIKDVNDKPVPQYWNPDTQRYEVIESKDGMLRTIFVNSNGEEIQTQNLVDQINAKLVELELAVDREKLDVLDGLISLLESLKDEWVGSENARVIAEQNRVIAEQNRVVAENTRETFINEHKLSEMPHQVKDLKLNKTYQYGLRVSTDGNPQLIFNEVVE